MTGPSEHPVTPDATVAPHRSDVILEAKLTPAQVKRRAATGVALLAGRNVAFRVIGLLGNLVLARLLAPKDFGVVAVGVTIISVAQFLTDAGVGSAVVARPEPPSRGELRAIAGLQVGVATVVSLVGLGVSLGLGESGRLTALMMVALPLLALRGPILLVLQRQLAFGLRVKIEVTEILTYLVVSIVLAALGLGALSLVIATILRAGAGTAVALAVSPMGAIVPSLRLARLRPILGFGVRLQAAGVVQVAQDTALTAAIGAVAGFTALGLWSLATRILSIPQLLFESMWSVAFPAFARLDEAGQDLRDLLERSASTLAVGVAALMTPIVAGAPASVPVLFGSVWSDVSLILPGAAFVLVLSGPVNISVSAYLYAVGDAKTPLRGAAVGAAARLLLTLALLPSLGVAAIGIAWALATLVELPVYLRPTRRHSGARLLRCTVPPLAAGIGGSAAGWIAAEHYGATVASLLIATGIGASAFAVLLLVIGREPLGAARMTARSMLAAIRRSPTDPGAAYAEK
jgi:O-antigen/teichoic acid export membrane protein